LRLQGTWMDGQGDSYIPHQILFAGGIINIFFLMFYNDKQDFHA